MDGETCCERGGCKYGEYLEITRFLYDNIKGMSTLSILEF